MSPSALARLGTESARAVRPWLRPAHWTRENLSGLAAAAGRRPRPALGWAGGALVVLALLAWALSGGDGSLATATARQGPFRVVVVETGTLQALRSVTYASRIQSNQAKVVALAPEGKLVEEGDLLILFDAAPFEDEIRRNQALLAQAEADLLKAGEDLKLQALQNTEELQAARLRVEETDLETRVFNDSADYWQMALCYWVDAINNECRYTHRSNGN